MTKKELINTFPSFDEQLKEDLKDIEYAKVFLEESFKQYLEDGNKKAFLACLKPLIQSKGTISEFAEKTSFNRTYLYKIFNNTINPDFDTLSGILNALGFEFSITIKKTA